MDKIGFYVQEKIRTSIIKDINSHTQASTKFMNDVSYIMIMHRINLNAERLHAILQLHIRLTCIK